MKIGALLGPISPGASPTSLADQVKEYETAGFKSLWTAHAVGRGFATMDPIQAMTIAATHSTELEIGSAILQIPLYNPYELALRILSLQQVCGDRLTLGVGAGSTQHDFDALGLDYGNRFKTYHASLAVLREVFTAGKWEGGDFTPWPEVLGKTRLFFGTWGNGVKVAAEKYDGWIASGMYRTPEQLREAHQRYQAAGGGRSVVSTILVDAKTDVGELRDRLQTYADIGFDDAVVMRLPGARAANEIANLLA